MIILSVSLMLAAAVAPSEPAGQSAAVQQVARGSVDVLELQRLATSGDVVAMRDYGLLLWKGEVIRRDREAAVGWFYEAALRNDAPSMFILGRAFERGEGVGRDLKLADYWTSRAFQNGYKDAGR